MPEHVPVMLNTVIGLLAGLNVGVILDCTVGAGGHARALLEACGPDARLVGFDKDPDAIKTARKNLSGFGDRVRLVNRDYRFAAEELAGIQADRVLVDLGISSMQLASDRGFSFQGAQPLDMRMDPGSQVTAMDILRNMRPNQLAALFRDAGVTRPAVLARAIKKAIQEGSLRTTRDLAGISRAVLGHHRKHDPATLPFMALRLAVNREMDALKAFLKDLENITAPGGRVAILTFHSIEDRLVKQAFAALRTRGWETPYKKGITPDDQEVEANPRARSARLRYIRRPI